MESSNIDDMAAALATVLAILSVVFFYFLWKKSNIVQFKDRSTKKNKSYIQKVLKCIFPVVRPDPVKNCPIYKKDGCAHVDGPLCDIEKCNPSLKGNNVINIKKEE